MRIIAGIVGFLSAVITIALGMASFAAISTESHAARRPRVPVLEERQDPPQGLGDPELAAGGRGWHIAAVKADKAWRITRGAPEISVAIVDSGIEYNHPDLAANVKRLPVRNSDETTQTVGWDFDREAPLPWDDQGHGTFVAGLAAATGDNGVGSSGVCPRCSILSYKFLDADGYGDDADAARGIRRAVKDGARVINLSFAGEGSDAAIREAIRYAAAHEVVVVAAAGNDSEDAGKGDIYPAKWEYPNMIKVAATDERGRLCSRSNFSPRYITLGAPGKFLVSTWIKGSIDIDDNPQGSTSIAAPLVTGAAGLVLSANPKLTAVQVVKIIEATVTYSAALEGRIRTSGVVNVEAAVKCAKQPELNCLRRRTPNQD